MLAAFFDPCFLYRKVDGILTGIVELAADVSISTVLPEYQQTEKHHTKSFITRKTATLPLLFFGTLIEYNVMKTGLFVSQDNYIEKLKIF